MKRLIVSPAPHFHTEDSVRGIMLDVIIALSPAAIASVWIFGVRSLFVMLTCIGSAVISEYISRKIMKRDNTIGDLSAVVTGLLLAFNLPVSLPLWMAALGSAVAIIVVKQFFGGIGQNFVNPALIGRIVLMTSFPAAMSSWTTPFAWRGADAVTSATPMAILKAGELENMPSLFQLFFGQHKGSLGETCAFALLLGGIYLVVRRVISPVVPLTFIGTVAVITLLCGSDPLRQVLSGGLMLGAIFMATDYATSPVNLKGKIIFGIGCGLITSFIRLTGALPEGVSFAIILMNILTPAIERLTVSRPFGYEKKIKG